MRNRISLADFPAAGPFLRAYADPAQWSGALADWYHYNAHDPECFAPRIAELEARPSNADRVAIASALAEVQRSYGADESAVASALSLGGPNTFAVLTGQQVGLFGGPLFTQFKAATVIRLVRLLKQQFPRHNFVPCFWMATGDSDFDEVRKTSVLGRDGEPVEIALPHNGTQWEGQVIGQRESSAHLEAALTQLADALPGGEHRDVVYQAVSADYASGNLAQGFARWMARLFAGTGLVLVDAMTPAFSNTLGKLAQQEVTNADELEAAFVSRNEVITGTGLPVQVSHLQGDTNLFLLADGRREKLSRDEGSFVIRPSGKRYSADELLTLVQDKPSRFVAGALLNPLYQDALLSPVAFIGGAAEIAYRAQSTALADLHGMKLAPAFFRASATLLPQKSAEALNELGWELSDMYAPEQELTGRAVATDKPAELQQALDQYLAALHGADARLRELAVALDPELDATFDTLRGNLIRHVEKLEKKITGSLKQRADSCLRRLSLAHRHAYPRHQVQERELNLLSFLPRYGFGLIQRLIDELEVPCWEHQVVVL